MWKVVINPSSFAYWVRKKDRVVGKHLESVEGVSEGKN